MNASDIDLIERKCIMQARHNFYAFVRYMYPKNVTGWFQFEICMHLQKWLEDYQAGLRPVLIINCPPQHGKSFLVTHFAAWLIGHNPDWRVIYASFSDRLAIRANLQVQRVMENFKFQKIFPEVRMPTRSDTSYTRGRNLIEFPDYLGYFRNTTVKGAITGESLDVGIIDDPIKGRAQANSILERDTVWDWFTDDFFSRFSDTAGLISIATRWHLDDPIGRLIDKYQSSGQPLTLVSYPALAEEPERHRNIGDALFPELKSKDFLLQRKSVLSSESWQSLYQQHPVAVGGNLIKTDRFSSYKVLPQLKYMRVFVDTASKTKEMNDYTVFGLYGLSTDNHLYVIDILRCKLEFTPMKQAAKAFWHKWKEYANRGSVLNRIPLRDLAVEDKSAGTQLIQDLRLEDTIPITPIQRNTDKYTRLMNVIGYIDSGYVYVPEDAPWLLDFILECQSFTGLGDTHDDQVDTLIDALDFMLNAENADLLIWENLEG